MSLTRRLRSVAHNASVTAVRGAADRLGFDTVWRDYYSPIPDRRHLDDSWWAQPSELPGVTFDLDAQLTWLEELVPYLEEFRPPRLARSPQEYGWDNDGFGVVDAAILYATIRRGRPTRILELGAGRSTLVAANACRLNAAEGHGVQFTTADPFPPSFLDPLPAGVDRLVIVGARDLDLALFAALGDGDILFIDTTHTVKVGSEVNFLLLEILPRLAEGVLVHVHDIFLPYEYPRRWLEERAYFWGEQYLLHGLLLENTSWEILFAAHAIARRHPQRLGELITGFDPTAAASFWLRRVGVPRRT